MDVYQQLLKQIDKFVDKFYLNVTFRGLLLFGSILLLTGLSFAAAEYFFRLGSSFRALLFFGFIGLNLLTFVSFIVIPVLKRFRVLKTISREEAALRIGNFFPEIGDKLLNTLQLKKQQPEKTGNERMLIAAVEQRVNTLKVFRFDHAIQWKENFKYLKYFGPLFLLFLGIAIINPKILSESSERIINYNNAYIPPAPFSFVLVTDSLEVIEGDKFRLDVKLEGDEIPAKVELKTSQSSYFLRKSDAQSFYYEFPKVKDEFTFHLIANGYRSKDFHITVIPKPHFKNTLLKVVPPSYTQVAPETFNNLRDLVIPEGSCVEWNFNAVNIDDLQLVFSDTTLSETNSFLRAQFQSCFRKNAPYHLVIGNDKIAKNDSLYYNINVIKDAHPKISLDYEVDSTQRFQYYFSGKASDDYGLKGLLFHYIVKEENGNTVFKESMPVEQKRSGNTSRYFHRFDFSVLSLAPGQTLDFYFSVSDNDQINGSKTSTTEHIFIQLPNEEELEKMEYASTESASNNMQDVMKKFKQFNKDMDNFKNDMLQKSSPDWEDLEQFKELKKERQKLEDQLKKMKNEMDQQEDLLKNLNKEDEDQLKKDKIKELMEELMDEELKELLDELEELLKKNQNPQEKMEQLQEKNEDTEKDLDRTMELLKHLELEMKMEELEKELEKLSKEQEELAKENDKNANPEDIKKKQEDIDKKFEEIKEKIKKMEEKNKELKSPKDMPPTDQEQKDIQKSLDEAKEQLEQKKSKKSKQQQQKASEQMKDLSQKFSQMQMQMQQQQQSEDMEALRLLLENLLSLSLDQEGLMLDLNGVEAGSYNYNQLTREQKKINDNTKIVDDSLTALAQRNPMLSSFINEELNDLNRNLDKSLKGIVENQNNFAVHQQYAMTNYNNLALMLSEALEQMQKQMAAQKPGSAMCNKPGGSNPSPGMSMEQMKKMLKEQMDKMKDGEEGKDGKKPGGDKGDNPIKLPGGKNGQGGMSAKEKAEMAKQQAKMKESLKEMKEKAGKELGKQLQDLINDLEKSEEDIVNNRMNSEWMKRQQDIMTRLLESEKAMREREFDEKRESKSGKNEKNSNQKEYLQYKRRKEKELELLRSLPPELKIYYRNKASEYFNKVMD